MNRKKKKQELTDIQSPRWIVIRFLGIMISEDVMINVKKHVFADNQNVEVLNNNRTQVFRSLVPWHGQVTLSMSV